MTARLRLEDVRAGYGSVRVLDGVSLEVPDAACVAVLGPNGSGKSTLAKTVMALTTLYGGTVRWDGEDLRGVPTWRRTLTGFGYVPQVRDVFPTLTVAENLDVTVSVRPRRQRQPAIHRAYEAFPPLADRRAIRAGYLSGGERRMLALACVLVLDPELLILDEPTSDLAPLVIDEIVRLIDRVRTDRELPLLLVEQNVGRALELAERVAVLVRGEKVLDEPVEAVSEEQLGRLFLR